MLRKWILVVLIIATAVEGTLVSAANVSVTIQCHGVITYRPGDVEEDIPSTGNNSSDIFDDALENLSETNHKDTHAHMIRSFQKENPLVEN